MKKLLLLLVLIPLIYSCTNPEKRAKELINEDLRTSLHDFSSYEVVEFGFLDSTFTSFYDTPQGDSLSKIASKALNESRRIGDEGMGYRQRADYSLSASTKKYYLGKAREKFNEAKEYAELALLYENRIDSLKSLFIPKFNGWKMKHSFRSKTLGGNFKLAHYMYYFDIEVTKIVGSENSSTD